MDSLPSPGQDPLAVKLDTSSTLALLESGLNCVRQGRFSEAVAHFALAREQLSPNLIHLATVLDACIQDYVDYWQAQQALHQASEHLVGVHTKQQARVTTLEKLLNTLMKTIPESKSAVPQPTKSPVDPQFPPTSQPSSFVEEEAQSSMSSVVNLRPCKPLERVQHAEEGDALPALYFTCFGRFEVRRLGQPVSLCSNRNGQAILRYMVAQSNHRVTMDTLMALLWPEDEPEVAHHKLQVAISALRRSLNNGYVSDTGGGYIDCKNGVYQLNLAVSIRTDVDEFLAFYRAGRQQKSISATVADYEAACHLYKGAFLTEDLYVDWPIIQREQLNQAYLAMCGALSEHYREIGSYEDAAKWASAILKENHCDEVAHRQLMRINVAAGRRSEALRQYQRCERILAEELNVSPMPETVNLFHAILSNESSN